MSEKKFHLEFIKFYPEIQKDYGLSPIETLIYGYVTEVISFQKKVGNQPVCFTSSETISSNLNCKPQTVNNSIKKLKDKGLIEVRNTFIKETKRKYRHIYIPGEAPMNKNDLVSDFFKAYTRLFDSPSTRGIIGDLIYHQHKTIVEIIAILEDYYRGDYEIELEDLRFLYQIISKETGFQEGIERKIEAKEKSTCSVCNQRYDYKGECWCDLPF